MSHEPRRVRLPRAALWPSPGAITGPDAESEPTPKQLDARDPARPADACNDGLLRTARLARLADTVAREVGARTAVLDPIEGLTPSEQQQGKTYLALMRENLAALRKALACR